MLFHSTGKKSKKADFKEVLMRGLASDGGLFMPDNFPAISEPFLRNIKSKSFADIAFEVSRQFISDIPDRDLRKIIRSSFNFKVPLRKISENLHVLELWHGPTLAFKDFGARFMAKLMDYYLGKSRKKINIIVATSGDTGSAVASGFHGLSNINVFVLYPSGRVTDLQEKQMATLGKNITAVEVRGSFDDCQKLAKQVLNDYGLRRRLNLSSANSINFGRLLPQSFYYWFAYAAMFRAGVKQFSFCVPGGNFGNLTAGLMAQRMGMDVSRFIAATNSNDVVPHYLNSGKFVSRVSRKTISNAMDVGNPSNFSRILEMFHGDVKQMRKDIAGISISDEATRETVKQVYRETKYISDPHTAVGIAAATCEFRERSSHRMMATNELSCSVVVLSTAHPAKFREVIEPIIGKKIKLPKQLSVLAGKKKKSVIIGNDFKVLKQIILKKNSA